MKKQRRAKSKRVQGAPGPQGLAASPSLGMVSVADPPYNAALNGVTDDSAAIQNALNSGAKVVYVPPGVTARLSTGIIIPIGVSLLSFDHAIEPLSGTGTTLLFDLGVPVCVTMMGNFNYGGSSLSGFMISRAPGAIPSGCIGVQAGSQGTRQDGRSNTAANCKVDHVLVWRHAIGYQFWGGVQLNGDKLFSGVITQDHVQISNFPQVWICNSWFGSNGPNDVACNSYVKIFGAGNNTNTVMFSNILFDQGSGALANYCIDFEGVNSAWGQFNFSACHCEDVATAFIHSDSTATLIRNLVLTDFTFNNPAALFALSSSTLLRDCSLHNVHVDPEGDGSNYLIGAWTLSNPVVNLRASNCVFTSATLAANPAGATMSFSGCFFMGNLTLSGTWGAFALMGGHVYGNFSDTSGGNKNINGA